MKKVLELNFLFLHPFYRIAAGTFNSSQQQKEQNGFPNFTKIKQEPGLDGSYWAPRTKTKTPKRERKNSKRRLLSSSSSEEEVEEKKVDESKYCFCRMKSYGNMIACEGVGCPIEWFHYGCVGITHAPKGKWFCRECRKKLDEEEVEEVSDELTWFGHKI